MTQQQTQLDDRLSELRQQLWIELWELNDSSVIIKTYDEEEPNIIRLQSLINSDSINVEYPTELGEYITPLFLETLRQEFVNAKIIEFDFHKLTKIVDDMLRRIERRMTDRIEQYELFEDYQKWRSSINSLVERLNEISAVLNQQVEKVGQ